MIVSPRMIRSFHLQVVSPTSKSFRLHRSRFAYIEVVSPTMQPTRSESTRLHNVSRVAQTKINAHHCQTSFGEREAEGKIT